MHQSLNRRDVIKTILVTSAYSIINNKLWAAKLVGDVKANAIDPTLGIARIQASSFTALNTNGGSVRLGSSNISGNLPRGALYPVIINRISETEYLTFESACLHEGSVIGKIPTANLNGRMVCPNHGAQYDIRGVCRQNPNSSSGFVGQSLLSYPTTIANGVLTIEFIGLGFEFTQQTVLNVGEPRLEISWDALDLVEYDIRRRTSLDAEATAVNCSLTLAGAFTSTFVPGLINGGRRTVYIQPQDGFFQVAVRMRSL